MSFWFIAKCDLRMDEQNPAVLFAANGLPDLSKALSRDHLREWVKHLHPDAFPEKIDEDANRYWQLISSLHRDDSIVAVKDEKTLVLAEIIQDYHYEANGQGGAYAWPVRFISTDVPLASFKALQPYTGLRVLKEIPESEARIQFRKYIPSWQTRTYLLFRWVSAVMLLAELAYFWPRK